MPCDTADECESGFCADGVCCDSACSGDQCQACSVAAGASVDGVCGAKADNTACDDGKSCTVGDTCHNGSCTPGSTGNCSNAIDACHAATACNADGSCGTALLSDASLQANNLCWSARYSYCGLTGTCPVDCELTDWSAPGQCSAACGGGLQTSTRTVITQPANGGAACGELTRSQECNTQPCAIDCVSHWSDWSDCSAACGGGTQTSNLIITTQAANGGVACPAEQTRSQSCNPQACPVDCVVGDWSDWGACTANDNGIGATQTRTRAVSTAAANGGNACPALTESQPCNLPPVANAGPDQGDICAGSTVVLSGSATDPDGDALTYAWSSLTPGLSRDADADPVYSFVAPLSAAGQKLTFLLTVTDAGGLTGTSTVNVAVKNQNTAPVAYAGDSQAVNEGSLVTLDGSKSYDPDLDSLSYAWRQTAGPTVTLDDPTAQKPTFTAPQVNAAGVTLAFELTVKDMPAFSRECGAALTDVSTVTVKVENVNHPPVADASDTANVTYNSGSTGTLDGSASSDPDGDPLTYHWSQTGGPAAHINDPDSAVTTFAAPDVTPGTTQTLTFVLTVSDGQTSRSVEVNITVKGPLVPPDCSRAAPSVASLWPPNHKMVAVSIFGVTDPNDAAHPVVTSVYQDEPTNGLGDGDTPIDAVIQSDGSVLLRSERTGLGNGRVYHVNFTDVDKYGASCTGSVTVCVPHDQSPAGSKCIDGGALYDSTK
jgi:hypothetical protein